MDKIEQEFAKKLGPEFVKSGKPHAYFFDSCVKDGEASEKSGRPRFKNAVYISKRKKGGTTQEFHRAIEAGDKEAYPREWEHYLKVRDNLAKPSIKLLPGIDEATKAEMNALGIYRLEQLVALDEDYFDEWKQIARGILNATRNEKGSEGRQDLSSHDQGQVIGVLAGDNQPHAIREGVDNESQEQGEVTFNYEVKVA